jgi:hypothetical protein
MATSLARLNDDRRGEPLAAPEFHVLGYALGICLAGLLDTM